MRVEERQRRQVVGRAQAGEAVVDAGRAEVEGVRRAGQQLVQQRAESVGLVPEVEAGEVGVVEEAAANLGRPAPQA